MSRIVREIPLGTDGLTLIIILALISFSISVGYDTETSWVVKLLCVILAWAGDTIIDILLLTVSSSKNGLHLTVQFAVDLVFSWAGNLHLSFEVSFLSLRDAEGMRGLCKLDDVLILVWCR